MLAGVIFDFDGVIVDSHPAHMQAWKALLLSKGKKIDDAALSFVREGAKREEILRHFLGELTPEQIASYGAEKDKLFQAHASELKLVRGFAEFLLQVDAAGLPMRSGNFRQPQTSGTGAPDIQLAQPLSGCGDIRRCWQRQTRSSFIFAGGSSVAG